VAVSARSKAKKRDIDLSSIRWERDPLALATAPDIDVVVELIGGSGGVARRLVQTALRAGKHVVTANKALLAMHGAELAELAERKNRILAFEAAVAGGIPIIKALREGLVGNRVRRLYGILNGTCNYILTTMRETGRDFDVVLKEAQAAGYAEADPSFDVDGIDAAHKLAVLTGAAFGAKVNFAGVHVEGIRRVTSMDIEFARELGYRIKLLGLARETRYGIEQRVHPCMVSLEAPIAHIEGVFNAVVVEGDFVGTTMFQGRGAGQGPTASAVVADLVDVARGRHMPAFVVPAARLADKPAAPMERHNGAYYIRLMVQDRPGVISAVSGALAKERISLESMLQRGRSQSGEVPVVLTTHETEEKAMQRALARIAKLGAVAEPPCLIRIEQL
jgi:homoserine dehydrogenase